MAAKSVYAFVSLILTVQQIHCENTITQCGITSLEVSEQIAGAVNDPDKNPVGEWPWMASLGYYEDGKWEHKCGTTLISDQQFITSAHCVKTLDSEWKIKAGNSELNPKKPPRQLLDLDIKGVSVHPRFDDTAYFDIAVLTTQVIQLNKKIRPVCLPNEPNVDSDKYKFRHATIIGWGSASLTSPVSDLLRRVDNEIYPKKHCNDVYKSQTQDTVPRLFESQVICAGSNFGRQGSCKGDSGGPLMVLDTESDTKKFVQIGMVQGSIGTCGDKNIPSIYVRLDDPDIFNFLRCSQSGTCELSSAHNGSEVAQYTKLAVGLGRNGEWLDDFEVIDLALPTRHCKNLPTFPYKNGKASGILVDGDVPLVCGGEFNSTSCYTLKNNAWLSAAPLNEGRSSFGMTRSPFADELSSVFVVGGNFHESSEVLKENHWVYSSNMPVGISDHCVVQPDENSVMVIGGSRSSGSQSTTYTFNSQTKEWTAGIELSQQRIDFACAMIRMDSQSKEKSIIAIGGMRWNLGEEVRFDTTEVLDPGSSVWRRGPQLPVKLCCGSVVELPSGGIIYTAGFSWEWDGATDKLLKLDHANAEWEVLPQKLKTARHFNTAFLIPDEMADCN